MSTTKPINLPEHYEHGIEVRFEWKSWQLLERQFVCAHCRASIGAPYADPETGELDHSVRVCRGRVPHVILSERDVLNKSKADYIDHKAQERDHAARKALGLEPGVSERLSRGLYNEDDDFLV